jgi:hypothetical protein
MSLEPSESHPELGSVALYGVAVSAAVYFLGEDGEHVVRSTEFDLHGDGDDLQKALAQFDGVASDYPGYIAEDAAAGDATEYELRQGVLLGRRLSDAYAAGARRAPTGRAIAPALRAARWRHRPAEAWILEQAAAAVVEPPATR